MIRVLSAEFLRSAVALDQCPREPVPEIAFAGRSNVGKSSMINSLTHRKKLVRVSNTPGRTRALNFFEVGLDARGRKHKLRLCDLPGYGYAKVSKAEREAWQQLITAYLEGRPQLKAVVVIVDAEVGPTKDDAQLIDFLQETPARILVVATKLDRLGKAQRKPRLHEVRKILELPEGSVEGFSSVDGTGLEAVWGRILDALVPARR
jgi:GTP-binding protein